MTLDYLLQTNVWIQILGKNIVSDQERPEFLNILCKMCDRQRITPTSMDIKGCRREEPNPAKTGGNADVFRGIHRGRRVAIKVVRVYLSDLDLHRRVSLSVLMNLGIRPQLHRL